MRKVATFLSIVVLCELGAVSAKASPRPADQPRTMDEVIDRVITNENRANQQIKQYSPLVETYIQNLKPDKELGYTPAGDKYFLGRADFSKGVALVSLTDNNSKGKKIFGSVGNFFSFAMQFLPDGFLQMIFIDTNGFDKQHYHFDYVRREFLGEVRCLVFDVTPVDKTGKGRFLGRIWVEDQDFNIVRFNGAYGGGGHSSWYFHFDSWRTNVQPGIWMPSFVYSEEKDLHYALAKKLDFKAQTRLWGYNLGHASQEQELSKILVEAPVQDDTKTANDLSPIQAQRSWDRQAEDNVIDRLERIGLIAPKGEVDKALETVVNNLEVTNNIDLDPDVRCRVMTTTTLESYTVGHTIVLSRGLIDVLPDEASLATISAHLGDRVPVIGALRTSLPTDQKQDPQMITALPIGGRVKLDPWNDKLDLIKSKPIGAVAEREKMPFEVTPFMPYLTRYTTEAAKPIAASAVTPTDPKTGESAPGKP